MIQIEEIPAARAGEFWELQFAYLVNDGMIAGEEEKAYFSSDGYRSTLEAYMSREPDRLHMVYFVEDGTRIGASQYCIYKSEDGKCFLLDFWIFPEYRGGGTGGACFQALEVYTARDGARYYALNYAKEASRRFWLAHGFQDDGVDEYGTSRMIRR